jgi:hypothetical protein
MIMRSTHYAAAALVVAAFLTPSAHAESRSACGVAGAANCGTLSLNQTSGACVLLNQGTLNEQMQCTATTYVATANTLNWLNGGTFYLHAAGIAPSGCTSYDDGRSWGVPATPQTLSVSVSCPAFTLYYNQCIGWPGAYATVTFDATLAPPDLSARVYATGSYNCIPA